MSFSGQQACPQDFKIWPMAYIPFSIFPPSSNRNLPQAVKMPCLAKRFSMLRMTYQRHSLEDEGFFPTEMGRNGVNTRLETNIAPTRLRHPKRKTIVFQPSICRCDVSIMDAMSSLAQHKHWRFMASAQEIQH